MQRERLQNYVGNGEKAKPTFSASEMQRRQDAIRAHMAEAGIDAAGIRASVLKRWPALGATQPPLTAAG